MAGLARLWGGDTLEKLREYVRRGDIKAPNIATMAGRMGVRRVYNENCDRMDLVETFERMLEEWYNQTLFDIEPLEAKHDLVRILEKSRCQRKFISRIGKLCGIDEDH